jgi:uncharacterized protein (TIGR03118 family)
MLKAISQRRSAWAGGFLLALVSLPAFAQHFTRTDLTVNQPSVSATAPNVDPNLVNAWGLSRATGSPWWISDNGAGVSTLYNAAGVAQPLPPNGPLVVKIPSPTDGAISTPTGTVFNYTAGFEVAPGKKSIFLFVTEDGTISGWNPGVKPTESVIMVNRSGKAVYKGCTLATTQFGTFLYVTNFKTGDIEVYDSKFQRVFGFGFHADRDDDHHGHNMRGFSPFNIQNVGGSLVVTYAKKEKGSNDEAHGPGLGAVAIFNPFGRLIQRLDRGPFLNAPWGVAEAPSDFGTFSHRLLIGNFGDGTINAFNPISGEFEGKLLDANGAALWIDGLWALSFGSNGPSGSAIELYFTAGPNDEGDGLFGKIAPAAAEQRGNNE